MEEFDGIQQVSTEYLPGTRSCAKILDIQRYLRMGQPCRGPSLEGLTDIHTAELQGGWSYHQIETSAEVGEEHRVGRDEFRLHLEMGWEGFLEVVTVELGLEG